MGEHVPFGAGIIPAGHAAVISTTQEPSSRQQATPGHGLGTHETPAMKTLGGWHWKMLATTHCPVTRQHAPLQGLGEQMFPGAGRDPGGQTAPNTKKHDPSSRQQAFWIWIGQAIGPPHVPPGAGVVPVGQDVPTKLKHVPSASQHATKHGLGTQPVAPETMKPWHAVPSGISVHDPSGRQQTTVGSGQGFGTQVLPGAGVVPPGQETPTKMKHAFRSQQASRQGLGVQLVAPGSTKPLHALGVGTSVHVPSLKQQTNPGGHWFGVHVLPGAGEDPGGHGPATVKHEPSTRQQARTHGLGTHEPPGMKFPNGATH